MKTSRTIFWPLILLLASTVALFSYRQLSRTPGKRTTPDHAAQPHQAGLTAHDSNGSHLHKSQDLASLIEQLQHRVRSSSFPDDWIDLLLAIEDLLKDAPDDSTAWETIWKLALDTEAGPTLRGCAVVLYSVGNSSKRRAALRQLLPSCMDRLALVIAHGLLLKPDRLELQRSQRIDFWRGFFLDRHLTRYLVTGYADALKNRIKEDPTFKGLELDSVGNTFYAQHLTTLEAENKQAFLTYIQSGGDAGTRTELLEYVPADSDGRPVARTVFQDAGNSTFVRARALEYLIRFKDNDNWDTFRVALENETNPSLKAIAATGLLHTSGGDKDTTAVIIARQISTAPLDLKTVTHLGTCLSLLDTGKAIECIEEHMLRSPRVDIRQAGLASLLYFSSDSPTRSMRADRLAGFLDDPDWDIAKTAAMNVARFRETYSEKTRIVLIARIEILIARAEREFEKDDLRDVIKKLGGE